LNSEKLRGIVRYRETENDGTLATISNSKCRGGVVNDIRLNAIDDIVQRVIVDLEPRLVLVRKVGHIVKVC
jgi:hypothetical protein